MPRHKTKTDPQARFRQEMRALLQDTGWFSSWFCTLQHSEDDFQKLTALDADPDALLDGIESVTQANIAFAGASRWRIVAWRIALVQQHHCYPLWCLERPLLPTILCLSYLSNIQSMFQAEQRRIYLHDPDLDPLDFVVRIWTLYPDSPVIGLAAASLLGDPRLTLEDVTDAVFQLTPLTRSLDQILAAFDLPNLLPIFGRDQ